MMSALRGAFCMCNLTKLFCSTTFYVKERLFLYSIYEQCTECTVESEYQSSCVTISILPADKMFLNLHLINFTVNKSYLSYFHCATCLFLFNHNLSSQVNGFFYCMLLTIQPDLMQFVSCSTEIIIDRIIKTFWSGKLQDWKQKQRWVIILL